MLSSSYLMMLQAIISALLLITVLVVFLLRFARGKLWVSVALGIALLDQVSKFVILHWLPKGGEISLGGSSAIVYSENRLLGFGTGANDLLLGTLAAVLVLILLSLRLRRYSYRMGLITEVACAFIIGGSAGILVDRIRLGYVIDWIDFGQKSDFIYNIADLAMIAASALFVVAIIHYFWRNKGIAPAASQATDSTGVNKETAAAGQIGRRAAHAIEGRFNGSDMQTIAQALGLKVKHLPSSEIRAMDLRVRSEYFGRSATIVLYDKPIEELRQLIKDRRPALAGLDLEQLHIAHELFHHLEVRHTPYSEEAAHAFVTELLKLGFSPKELDQLYAASDQ